MQNQMEKIMENEMETGMWGFIGLAEVGKSLNTSVTDQSEHQGL